MAIVTAYVDGFNLYYGIKHKFGRRYRWLDVVELVRRLRPDDDIAVVRYFTAVVKGEPAAAANQIEYVEAMQAHCGSVLDVQRGWFKPRGIGPCRTCGQHFECGCPRRFRTCEEKETDVALGASMVEDAAAGLGNLTLLISADSDFAPAVRSIKRLDVQRAVILAMPPGNLKPHKRFSNVGSFNINETALRHAQLPQAVTEPMTGRVRVRPSKWV
ncbi:MAG: hypothetical protein JWN95_1109 [Frankiales bacterium]|nr:hypothetical protein [Frankiales bacterium]